MDLKDIGKIVVLLVLFGLCIMKYTGCANPQTSSNTKIEQQEDVQQNQDDQEIPQEDNAKVKKIKTKVFAFLDALQKEDIPLAVELSTENAVASAMSIPVDHIEKYEIINVDYDRYSAQATAQINDQYITEVYLLKKMFGDWKVKSTISLSAPST